MINTTPHNWAPSSVGLSHATRRSSLYMVAFLMVLMWSSLGSGLALADPNHEIDTANWIALPISGVDGFFPTPWTCGGTAPSPHLRQCGQR
jgi:hypothetical protein